MCFVSFRGSLWHFFFEFSFSPLKYFKRAEFFQLFFFSSNAFFFPSDLSSLRFTFVVVVVFPVYIYIYFGCCFDRRSEHGGAKAVIEFPTRRIRSNARRKDNNNNNTEEKEDGDFKTLR